MSCWLPSGSDNSYPGFLDLGEAKQSFLGTRVMNAIRMARL